MCVNPTALTVKALGRDLSRLMVNPYSVASLQGQFVGCTQYTSAITTFLQIFAPPSFCCIVLRIQLLFPL